MTENVNSGKALNVFAVGVENGDDAIQWDLHRDDNQRWTFDPV